MRFASLDVAGNFSGWSEPERVVMPGILGMVAVPTSVAMLGLAALVAALAAATRVRRRC